MSVFSLIFAFMALGYVYGRKKNEQGRYMAVFAAIAVVVYFSVFDLTGWLAYNF